MTIELSFEILFGFIIIPALFAAIFNIHFRRRTDGIWIMS